MSVWHRITGFRGSGPPGEAEPNESSDVVPEQTQVGQSPDDGEPETAEPDQSLNDGSEATEPDEPADDEPEPSEPDESPDDGGPETAKLDQSLSDGSEAAEPDELAGDEPELSEPDESPDDGGPETEELDQSPNDGAEPDEPDEPDEPAGDEPELSEPDESPDDGGPETEELDQSPNDRSEPTEPDELAGDEPETSEPDESPDDGGPEPAELGQSLNDGSEPSETDESIDDNSIEPTEADELAEGGLRKDKSQDPTESAEHKRNQGRRPRNIRGRRTTPTSPPNEPSGGRRTFKPKPELICRRSTSSWQWDMILSVPRECNVARVRHRDNELTAENSEYRLPSFSDSLVIEYDHSASDEISLVGDAPLIFKLSSEWQGDGRRIGGITRGHFVVVAPCKWTRTGSAPVSPESCTDTDYTAHFFFVAQDDETGGFEEYPMPLTRTGLTLEGKRLHDDSEDGDLFVGDAPALKPAEGIIWARVGSEATNAWPGENFNPADRTLGDVLGKRQGRFYVRVYDESVSLVDSGEFRYCADLHEIRVNEESYSQDMLLAPSSRGHSPTALQFVVADGVSIQARAKTDKPHVTVAADGVATLAPHPDGDETMWTLGAGRGPDVVIRLPRIWWRMVRPNNNQGGWSDKAISMSRDEFRKQSYAETEVEIRVPSSVRNVHAGFGTGKDLNQSFRAERAERGLHHVSLPLNAFVDYEEIEGPLTRKVSLKIRCGGDDIELIHVIPDAPPPRPESLRDQTETTGSEARCDPERRQGSARTKRAKESEESGETAYSRENPVLELPQVPKEPLVVKNPLRRYHLDIARRGAALFTLIVRTKCPEHQLTENERSASHTSVGKHIKDVRECCASTADYLRSGRFLKDAVFRVVLSEYDRPLTAQQISDELNKRWPTSELDLSPRVIESILDADPNYAPAVQKNRSRRRRRARGYRSRRGWSQRK